MTTKRNRLRKQMAVMGLNARDITIIEESAAKQGISTMDFLSGLVIRDKQAREIRQCIQKMAVEIAEDYPGIAACDAWEQLYAIESSYKGTRRAIEDWHSLVKKMASDMGLTDEQVYERYCK